MSKEFLRGKMDCAEESVMGRGPLLGRGVALFLIAVTVALAVQGGVTATWTGAQDGFWTNSSNWAEGVVPGQYRDASGNVTGSICGTATFGSDALTGNCVTTIDFDGVYSISNLFTTGTAAYTYGTSANQEVPLEALGTFSAAETPDTPPATMVALLRLGVDDVIKGYGTGTMTIRNNSRSMFVLNDWGVDKKGPTTESVAQPGCRFDGSGDIKIAGAYSSKGLDYVMAHFAQTGRLIFAANTMFRQMNFDADSSGVTSLRRIVIEEGVEVKPSECGNCVYVYTPSEISGEGTWYFGYKSNKEFVVMVGYPLTISCSVKAKSFNASGSVDDLWRLRCCYGNGPLTINGSNDMNGLVGAVCGPDTSKPTVFAAPIFGCRGTYGNFGDCTFRMGDKSAIRYLGEGETMDRDIALTNYSTTAASSTIRLQQFGSGVWNVTSPVSLCGSLTSGVLALYTSVGAASATFAGSLASGIAVEKNDAGTWTFAPSGTFTDKIVLKGGALRIAKSMHVASLDPAVGTTRVFVEDGQTLEVDSVTRTGSASVDIVTVGPLSVVKIHNRLPGITIPGVTIGGVPVTVDAEGNVIPYDDGTTAIWRKPGSGAWTDETKWMGGRLPNRARDTFVTANGESYRVTLDQDWGITNITVRNLGGGTTSLLVTNGATLSAAGHCTDDAFVIGEGGCVDVIDATLRIEDLAAADGNPSVNSPLAIQGGNLTIAGTGALHHVSPPIARMTVAGNMDTCLFFGTGMTTFKGDAKFDIVGETNQVVGSTKRSSSFSHYVRPNAVGETATVRFQDRASIACNESWDLYALHVGGNNGTAIFEIDSLSEAEKPLWKKKFIGEHPGCGILRVSRGSHVARSYDALYVGTPNAEKTTDSACFATGIVEVASGASLQLPNGIARSESFATFVVGHALPLNKARTASSAYGKVTVGGTLTLDNGTAVIGGGATGVGEFVQNGGLVWQRRLRGEEYMGEFAIGVFGGRGSYTLNGGTFTTVNNVYVGGATTNDLHAVHKNGAFLMQQHDAEGTVSVNGGSFTAAKSIILGADGMGTLALCGTGMVSAAEIVVSNSASRLVFTADAQGRCGKIESATRLGFAFGAHVTVDVSAYAAMAQRRMTVWDLETAPEGLDGVTFDLVGAESSPVANRLVLSDDGRRLVWKIDHGTLLIVR